MSGRTGRLSALAAPVLVLAVVWAWLLGPMSGPAQAHTLETQGFSDISQDGDDIHYELLVDYAALAIVAGIGIPDSDPDSGARSAEEELAGGAGLIAEYLDERLEVLVDGVPCEAEVTGTGLEERFEEPYARVSLRYGCPGEGEYTVRYSALVGDLDPEHTNVAGYDLGGAAGQFVFDAENTELRAGEASVARQLFRFAALGFEHIMIGLDHVLFVIALVIGATRARDVIRVVTAFTLAHSVTLALAALDILRLPPSIVEPLIALSIAYVAVTSVLGRGDDRYRLAAVFGFGLLHGAGFAGALRLTGDVDASMLSSLLSFNVGIELGQALIVVVLFPVLSWSCSFQSCSSSADSPGRATCSSARPV